MKFEIMKNAFIWKQYERDMVRCRICGQYIENGESYGRLIVPARIGENSLVHEHEFYRVPGSTDEEKIYHIYQFAVPPAHNKNKEIPEITKLVVQVMKSMGFYDYRETRDNIYFKNSRNRDAARFVYHKRHKRFEYINKLGTFDRLFLSQVYTQIDNLLRTADGIDTTKIEFIYK